jgi:type IVB pilus formation R64 PilN family outer membrane protein
MLKKWIVFVFMAAFTLSACNSPVYNQTENNVADVKIKAKIARQKSDDSGKVPPALVMSKGQYVDRTPISLARNPSWLKDHIVIKGDQLPFSYYSRSVSAGAGYGILTKYQNGLDQGAKVSLNYSGTVRGALDLLSSKTGYAYTIEGQSIYWQAFVTKTFDIAFIPGGADYMMGKKSASGGGGQQNQSGSGTQDFTTSDSSNDQYSNMTGKLSVWADLETTVKQLMSPEGKVTVSQATTTVTVRDYPTNVQLVSQYVNNLNRKLSKQVLVKVQILQVNLENDFDMGINWQLIVKAFHNSPFVLNGSYGTPTTITSFVPQAALPASVGGSALTVPPLPQIGTIGDRLNPIPSYTILFNALNQQGKTSIVSEPRVVCLNNQVSVIRITTQKGYLASIQNTTLAGAASSAGSPATSTVTSQLTPGTIITGVTIYVLPKIINDKIIMQVNADLSVNPKIDTFGPPGGQIQLPTVDAKNFNQRSVIKSGDTLILAGFRQLINNAAATQLMKSQALGGKASSQTSTETVVLITPIILSGAV